MRGYIAHKNFLWNMMEKKTDICHEHFMKVRKAYIMDATIKICYHCFKFVLKLRKRKAEAAAKKAKEMAAAAAKKKKKFNPRSTVQPKTKVAAVSTTPIKQKETPVASSKGKELEPISPISRVVDTIS
jgi:ribosome-binding protein aMBF1 (putative translation factor)